MIKITVAPGEEVMETITKRLENERIRNGAIVSVVGAIDACCISSMPLNDPTTDILVDYEEPLEMTGTGAIEDGVPHIHCVLARAGNKAVAGHLHSAHVQNWFVDIFVIPMS